MKPRVIIRPGALIDLEEIAVWLGRERPAAAARFLENCVADLEKLAAMPSIGRPRQFSDPRAVNIRSWIVAGFPNHLVFYRPLEDGVEILHVLHGARRIEALFENEV